VLSLWLSREESPPPPSGNDLPNVGEGVAGNLCSTGVLLAHVPLDFHQDPQVLFSKGALHLVSPNIYGCMRFFLPRESSWHFLVLKFSRFLSDHFSSL